MKRYVCALLLMLAVSGASAGVIFSEDFEGGVNPSFVTAGNIISGTEFEVVSGSVDYIKPPSAYAVMCGAGGSCIDTTGSGTRGEIRTIAAIDFLPGIYYLSFNLQGWKDFNNLTRSASIQVLIPGLLDVTLSRNGANNPYDLEWMQFVVPTSQSVKLTFRDLSGNAGFAGAILDDVEIGTSTPEPSSLLLILSGFAALAVLRRRSVKGNRRKTV